MSELQRPLTVGAVAKRAGIEYDTALRLLWRLNDESGGKVLLRRTAARRRPSYAVDEEELRKVAPHLFRETPVDGELLEQLRVEVREKGNDIGMVVRRVAELSADVARLTAAEALQRETNRQLRKDIEDLKASVARARRSP